MRLKPLWQLSALSLLAFLLIPCFGYSQQAVPAIGATSLTFGPVAGSGSDEVSIAAASTWAASTGTSWIHLLVASGAESGLCQFSYDANPGATRSGSIAIQAGNANLTVTVMQAGGGYVQAAIVQTVVGSGLVNPEGIAADGKGNLYIADAGDYSLKVWSAAKGLSKLQTLAGQPSAVSIAANGNVYTRFASLNPLATNVVSYNPSTRAFSSIFASTADQDNNASLGEDALGDVYFLNITTVQLREWTASTGQVTTTLQSGLNQPEGLVGDVEGNLYLTDAPEVRVFNPTQNVLNTVFTTVDSNPPHDVAVDGSGNVYAKEQTPNSNTSNQLQVWNAATQTVSDLPSGTIEEGRGLTVDPLGNVYTSDGINNVIDEVPYAFVDSTPVIEPFTAGTDQLPPVQPVPFSLGAVSDASWLTIAGEAIGVVSYSFTANTTGTPRVAHITVFGQSVMVTQAPSVLSPQTITFGSIATQNVGSTLMLNAVASSGLPVTYTGYSPQVCSLSGNSVTFLEAGTCTIRASQPGDGVNYASAAPVSEDIVAVVPQPITVTGGLGLSTLVLGPNATSLSVEVVPGSTPVWTASTTASWIHLSATSGSAAGISKFTLDPNAGSTRTGVITYQVTSGLVSLTVTQAGYAYVNVAPVTTLVSGIDPAISVDTHGNLYIVDRQRYALDRWNASSGLIQLESFPSLPPSEVTVAPSGDVYIEEGGTFVDYNPLTDQLSTLFSTSVSTPESFGVDALGNVYFVSSS